MKQVTDTATLDVFTRESSKPESKPFAKLSDGIVYETVVTTAQEGEYTSASLYHVQGEKYWEVETETEVIHGKSIFHRQLYNFAKGMKLPARNTSARPRHSSSLRPFPPRTRAKRGGIRRRGASGEWLRKRSATATLWIVALRALRPRKA